MLDSPARPRLVDAATGLRLLEQSFDPASITQASREALVELHLADISAGAAAVSAGTFSLQAETDLRGAVASAALAISRSGSAIELLASLGPFGNYRRRAEVCLEAGASLVVLETFTVFDELAAALHELRGLPCLASLSPRLPKSAVEISHAQCDTIADRLQELGDAGASAVGVGCTSSPEHAESLLSALSRVPYPVLLRPGFLARGPHATRRFATVARSAWDAGIPWVGGCCGVTSEDLRAAKAGLLSEP